MILRQFARYIVVGAFNTGASYLVYVLFIWLGLPFQWANLIGGLVGVAISFTTQSRFVFDNRDWRRVVPFSLVWGVMYFVSSALIWVFKHNGLNDYAAGLIALPVVVGMTYLLQKFTVFRASNSPPRL